jgi:hypothetical protein
MFNTLYDIIHNLPIRRHGNNLLYNYTKKEYLFSAHCKSNKNLGFQCKSDTKWNIYYNFLLRYQKSLKGRYTKVQKKCFYQTLNRSDNFQQSLNKLSTDIRMASNLDLQSRQNSHQHKCIKLINFIDFS